MKKSILLSLAAFVAVCLASCGGSSKSAEAPAEQLEGISVDEVMANPDSLVGDTIVIEGVVSHLCRQGGRGTAPSRWTQGVRGRQRRQCHAAL